MRVSTSTELGRFSKNSTQSYPLILLVLIVSTHFFREMTVDLEMKDAPAEHVGAFCDDAR